MADDKNLELQIRAKNLTQQAFDSVSRALKALEEQSEQTTTKGASSWTKWFTTIAGGVAVGNLLSSTFQTVGGILAQIPGQLIALGQRGSDVAAVRGAFDSLTASVGQTADAILGQLRSAFGGTISDFELMKSSNDVLRRGVQLTADDFATLAQGSRILADQVGGNAKDSFDRMLSAIGKGNERELKDLGVNMANVERSVKAYADALGVETSALTTNHRQLALRNAVLDESKRLLRENGEATNSFADNVKGINTLLENWRDNLAEAIAKSPALNQVLNDLAQTLTATFGGDRSQQVKTLTGWVDQLTISMLGLLRETLSVGIGVTRVWAAIELAVLGALTSIASTPATLAKINAAVADKLSFMDPAAAARARDLSNWLTGFTKSLEEQTRQALAAVQGNNALERMLRGLEETLQRVQARAKDAANTPIVPGSGKPGGLPKLTNEVAALDKAQQGLLETLSGARAIRSAQDLVGLLDRLPRIQNLTAEAQAYINKTMLEALEVYDALGIKAPKALEDIYAATLKLGGQIPVIQGLNKELEKLGKPVWVSSWTQVGPVVNGLGKEFENLGERVDVVGLKGPSAFERTRRGVLELADEFQELARVSEGAFGKVVAEIANLIDAMNRADAAGERMAKGGWQNIVGGGLQGAAAIGQATSTGGRGSRTAKGALTGASIGANPALMAATGGWSVVIGAAAGAIVGYVRSLGQGRKAVEEFAKSFGGFDELHARLLRLGDAGEELWKQLTQGVGNNNPDQAADVIANVALQMAELEKRNREFNDGLTETLTSIQGLGFQLPESLAPYFDRLIEIGAVTEENVALLRGFAAGGEIDFRKMEEAAERYGISLDALGGNFWAAKLHANVEQILNDLDLFERGGADMNAVLSGMGDEIGEVVRRALVMGTSLPANLEPYIRRLLESGELVDALGNKITDINGLTFGDPIKVGLDAIVDRLEQLLRHLGAIPREVNVDVNVRQRGPGAITSTSSGPGDDFDPNTFDPRNDPRYREMLDGYSQGTRNYDYERFARGGTPVLLHGDEAVIPRAGVGQLAKDIASGLIGEIGGIVRGGADRPVFVNVTVELDGRVVLRRVLQGVANDEDGAQGKLQVYLGV